MIQKIRKSKIKFDQNFINFFIHSNIFRDTKIIRFRMIIIIQLNKLQNNYTVENF